MQCVLVPPCPVSQRGHLTKAPGEEVLGPDPMVRFQRWSPGLHLHVHHQIFCHHRDTTEKDMSNLFVARQLWLPTVLPKVLPTPSAGD